MATTVYERETCDAVSEFDGGRVGGKVGGRVGGRVGSRVGGKGQFMRSLLPIPATFPFAELTQYCV